MSTTTQILARDYFDSYKIFDYAIKPEITGVSGVISTTEDSTITVGGIFINSETIAILHPQGDSYLDYPIIQDVYDSESRNAIINIPPQSAGNYRLALINEDIFSESVIVKAIAPGNMTPWLAETTSVTADTIAFTGIKETVESDLPPVQYIVERGSTKNLSVCGEFFTTGMKAGLIPTGETDEALIKKLDISFNSITRELDFTVSETSDDGYFNTAADGIYDLIVEAPGGDQLVKPGVLEVKLIPWIDLRAGGETFTAEELTYATRLTLNRDAQGMWFSGDTGWDTWAYIDKLEHPRSAAKTYEWIFSHSSRAMMIGIAGENASPTTRAAYYEAEIVGYFNSQTSFYRFYGDRANGGSSSAVPANVPKKLILENNGEGGSDYYIYQLPSADPSDWSNTDADNLIVTGTIPDIFNQPDTRIAPYFIPHNSTHRLIGVRLK